MFGYSEIFDENVRFLGVKLSGKHPRFSQNKGFLLCFVFWQGSRAPFLKFLNVFRHCIHILGSKFLNISYWNVLLFLPQNVRVFGKNIRVPQVPRYQDYAALAVAYVIYLQTIDIQGRVHVAFDLCRYFHLLCLLNGPDLVKRLSRRS